MAALLIAVLFVAPFVDWTVALLLVRASRNYPKGHALRERAILAVVIAIAVTVYFLAALNAFAKYPAFDLETGQLIARLAVASIGLLPAYWLWIYARNGWRA
jgi:hypothetical protein